MRYPSIADSSRKAQPTYVLSSIGCPYEGMLLASCSTSALQGLKRILVGRSLNSKGSTVSAKNCRKPRQSDKALGVESDRPLLGIRVTSLYFVDSSL